MPGCCAAPLSCCRSLYGLGPLPVAEGGRGWLWPCTAILPPGRLASFLGGTRAGRCPSAHATYAHPCTAYGECTSFAHRLAN